MRATNIPWGKAKALYVSGRLGRQEILEKLSIKAATFDAKVNREGWHKLRKDFENRIANTATKATLAVVEDEAASWTRQQLDRCRTFRSKVMDTLNMTGGEIDPQALDQLTKAELRVDNMGRRALGLSDPKTIDVTSGGLPLGAYTDALNSVKRLVQTGGARSTDIDLDAMASLPFDGEAT